MSGEVEDHGGASAHPPDCSVEDGRERSELSKTSSLEWPQWRDRAFTGGGGKENRSWLLGALIAERGRDGLEAPGVSGGWQVASGARSADARGDLTSLRRVRQGSWPVGRPK
jgi:hypothetical protein